MMNGDHSRQRSREKYYDDETTKRNPIQHQPPQHNFNRPTNRQFVLLISARIKE